MKVEGWRPVAYRVGGHTITMEIAQVPPDERAALLPILADVLAWPPAMHSEADEARIKAAFVDGIRSVGGIQWDEDGIITPINTGARFYEVADRRLVTFVLSELAGVPPSQFAARGIRWVN